MTGTISPLWRRGSSPGGKGDVREDKDVASYQHEHRGAQRPPAARRPPRWRMTQVDGEALVGPAHQPRRRRRRRPRHLGEDARPDPRRRPGQPQRAGRHLAWCRPRKARSTRCTRSCSASASSPSSTTTARSRRPTRPRSRPRSRSSPRRSRRIVSTTTIQRHQPALRLDVADHLPGRRERRRDDRPDRHEPRRHRTSTASSSARSPTGADIDAIDTPLSSIADVRADLRRRPEPPRAHDREPRDLPGEPLRRRVAHPRRRHGLRDGDLHQAPDPPAVRRGHARPGQPGAERGALAAPRLDARSSQTSAGTHPPGGARAKDGVGLRSGTTIASVYPREHRSGPTQPPTGRRFPRHGGRSTFRGAIRGRSSRSRKHGAPSNARSPGSEYGRRRRPSTRPPRRPRRPRGARRRLRRPSPGTTPPAGRRRTPRRRRAHLDHAEALRDRVAVEQWDEANGARRRRVRPQPAIAPVVCPGTARGPQHQLARSATDAVGDQEAEEAERRRRAATRADPPTTITATAAPSARAARSGLSRHAAERGTRAQLAALDADRCRHHAVRADGVATVRARDQRLDRRVVHAARGGLVLDDSPCDRC